MGSRLYQWVPVALALSLMATVLFMVGLVTPHWFLVNLPGTNETVYYGLFLICHTQKHGCRTWNAHANDINKELLQKTPAERGASELILSLNAAALLECNIIFVYCLYKSYQRFWTKSAYHCILASSIYGVMGTAAFLGVRMHTENKVSVKFKDPKRLVSLQWSAFVAVTAVVLEAVTALLMKLVLLYSRTKNVQTITSTIVCDSRQSNKWNKIMNSEVINAASISSSQDSVNSDLLRIVQIQRQADMNRPPVKVTRTIGTYQGATNTQNQVMSLHGSPSQTLIRENSTTHLCQSSLSRTTTENNPFQENMYEKRESLQFDELLKLLSEADVEMKQESSVQTNIQTSMDKLPRGGEAINGTNSDLEKNKSGKQMRKANKHHEKNDRKRHANE